MLSAKAMWLADESVALAEALRTYGGYLHIEPHNQITLHMAAYLKNVGAIYLSSSALSSELSNPASHTAVKTSQLISARVARHAGLTQVASILDDYYQRSIPGDQLTSIFQITNAWVSCRQMKPYRQPLSISDAKVALRQRAEMCWSDPNLVEHFIACYPEANEA